MRLPVLFIGHGSPMNAIVQSKSTQLWSELGSEVPKPEAILVISAHWESSSLKVLGMEQPEMIYDMYGFPDKLYRVQYPAPGSPKLAHRIRELVGAEPIEKGPKHKGWGFDHGSWSVLTHMYPKADIPVVELSLDQTKSDQWHFELGKKLAPLRDEGVLIVCSGSIVHNLSAGRGGSFAAGPQWNDFVDSQVNARLPSSEHPLVHYKKHPLASTGNPDPEHFQPLLYFLGLLDANKEDKVTTYLKDQYDLPAVGMMAYALRDVSAVHNEL